MTFSLFFIVFNLPITKTYKSNKTNETQQDSLKKIWNHQMPIAFKYRKGKKPTITNTDNITSETKILWLLFKYSRIIPIAWKNK